MRSLTLSLLSLSLVLGVGCPSKDDADDTGDSDADTDADADTDTDADADADTDTDTDTDVPEMVVSAGDDIALTLGYAALLDGTDTTHTNDAPLTYAWTFLSLPEESALSNAGDDSGTDTAAPPSGDISDDSAEKASFLPDVVGDYTIDLTVSDGVETLSDEVTVTVTDDATDPGSCEGNSLSIDVSDSALTFDTFAWAPSPAGGQLYLWGFDSTDTGGLDACTVIQQHLSHAFDGENTLKVVLQSGEGGEPFFFDGQTIAWFPPPSTYPSESDVDGNITVEHRPSQLEDYTEQGTAVITTLASESGLVIDAVDATFHSDEEGTITGAINACYCANLGSFWD